MLGKSLELGELYKELRMARGLKLKDIARDNLSVSQLSKFENGQTMLAADKLLLAIQGIHMSFSEFGYALTQYQDSIFFKMGKKLVELQSHNDLAGLKELLATYSGDEVYETYNSLNKLVIKVVISTIEPSYQITDDEKEFLTSYLYAIEEWTEYELYLFGNTMIVLSDEDLVFLGKAFVERDKLYRSLASHKRNAELVLLNLILTLVERKKFYHANFFIENLDHLLSYQDMFAIIFKNFLKQVISYLTGEQDNLESIRKNIQAVEELGNPILAKFLRTNLEEIIKK
ncbi:MutR family transcriptional regulator [Streptococcus criceti]|uniref:Transcriptional regulator n=1 Tax=Streptococcus criceti HS-6 TaxID=873449 RepID=G5JSN3_STRCG|nr:Rgg/GadR/MutR family transcriptional regulator [Streptococcus criceti]EHI74111.1 transcriptional regulator [Streptococcus criceti HS-6]SUN37512.1 MutR family transcriptional regulator [Streptococcus criceti]